MSIKRAELRRQAREDERDDRYLDEGNELVARFHFMAKMAHGICTSCSKRKWLYLPARWCIRCVNEIVLLHRASSETS